ncbi:MAG: FAD:protein FMN transferase [Verrucomicrobia bacterium]|nr:FAD:protein FMN transferase [Verrucomicrobiota bacterium]
MKTVAVARRAMATRFEILLHGDDVIKLRAAGEEALNEVERLEAHLSLYRTASDISRVNARASVEPVRVEPGLFRLLQHAQKLHRESGGVFDITIAPLVRCWGFMGGTGQMPEEEEIQEARTRVGMDQMALGEEDFTVRFLREGMMLDLGAIGKGYAVERAAEILVEAGVTSALIHGGTSTVHAVGSPPDAEAWKVAVQSPEAQAVSACQLSQTEASLQSLGDSILAVVPLKDEAMSVSAVHGRSFMAQGKTYGHVIDPRTGYPAQNALLAAVVLPSATETDALSTALLTLGAMGHRQIAGLRDGMRTLLACRMEGDEELRVESQGINLKTV